ncbi:hypothetical protein [Streptococcus suis]|nr:hypothetical protein [Streptococcus suis]
MGNEAPVMCIKALEKNIKSILSMEKAKKIIEHSQLNNKSSELKI